MVMPDPFVQVTPYAGMTTVNPVGIIDNIGNRKPVRITFAAQDYGKFAEGDTIRISHTDLKLGRSAYEEKTFTLGNAAPVTNSFILLRNDAEIDPSHVITGGYAERLAKAPLLEIEPLGKKSAKSK